MCTWKQCLEGNGRQCQSQWSKEKVFIIYVTQPCDKCKEEYRTKLECTRTSMGRFGNDPTSVALLHWSYQWEYFPLIFKVCYQNKEIIDNKSYLIYFTKKALTLLQFKYNKIINHLIFKIQIFIEFVINYNFLS